MATLLLARIGAPHGVRGDLRVKSFTADPEAIRCYGELRAEDGRRFAIERLRAAKDMLIVKFRGVDDRDAAAALNGTDLFVERARLPKTDGPDVFYHADLIGLEAVRATGEALGTVVAIHNFGAGDVLDIAASRGPSLLVPFTKAATPEVDLAARRIVVAPLAETEAREGEE